MKEKLKKPFYKKWWVWLIAVIFIGMVGSLGENENASTPPSTQVVGNNTEPDEPVEIELSEEEIAVKEAEEKALAEKKAKEEERLKAEEEAKLKAEKEASIPREHRAALASAENYAKIMFMSKASIYDQLVSPYGENFPAEAAQYAIDNIQWNWKANALETAKTYADTMNMSNAAIYDQLVSEYGEQFTPDEAQYAIDNLD